MKKILEQLKIKADIISRSENETVVKYLLRLQPGGKLSTLENRVKEIALAMRSFNVPIVKPIIHEGLISLEFIVKPINNVSFFDILPALKSSDAYLPVILGRTYSGGDLVADLYKMPHLLIAGTTGSGKSVLLHSIICSSFYSNTKLALIDPKMVEFSAYNNLKNLTLPVATIPDEAYNVLGWCVEEMNDRFKKLKKYGCNNIIEYNIKKNPLPFIMLVIDEFSDLMMIGKKIFERKICELAQKGRAAGIHIVLATQRPDVKTITGTLKANFQSRICLRVPTMTDSRIVLDRGGGQTLLGNGDALINSGEHDLLRFKGAFVGMSQISDLVEKNKKSWWQRWMRQ